MHGPARRSVHLAVVAALAGCAPETGSPDHAADEARGRLVLGDPPWYALAGGSRPAALGDIDVDGRAEVSIGGGSVIGVGNMEPPAAWQGSPGYPATVPVPSVLGGGDVNGDGRPDVLAGGDGAIHVFTAALGTAATYTLSGSPSSEFGVSMDFGDVDGDAFADFAVGAPSDDAGGTDAGHVVVYRGSGTGAPTAVATIDGDQAGQRLGATVVLADIDGDGLDDLVASAPKWDGTRTDQGRVLSWANLGGAFATSPVLVTTLAQTGAEIGTGLAAGDLDDDGDDDVFVGAPLYDGAGADQGQVSMYAGSTTGLGASAAWTTAPTLLSTGFGTSIAVVDDTDGDGFPELGVGSTLVDHGVTDGGAVFLYRGGSTGPAVTWSGAAWGTVNNQGLGRWVVNAGDTNGDGLGDVLVGPGLNLIYGAAGGGLSGPGTSADVVSTGTPAYTLYGVTMAVLDLNGDGYEDVVASSVRSQSSTWPYGGVWAGGPSGLSPTVTDTKLFLSNTNEWTGVFELGDVDGRPGPDFALATRGSSSPVDIFSGTGWATPLRWPVASKSVSAHATSVASADLNCDGHHDLIVGDGDYSSGQLQEGAVKVYAGSATGIVTTAPAWMYESGVDSRMAGRNVAGVPDLDGDGCDEVVVADYDRVSLLMGSASWPSTTPEWSYVVPGSASCQTRPVLQDVDADGRLDLLWGCHSTGFKGWYGFRGRATGYFDPTPTWSRITSVTEPVRQMAVADFDLDGYPDVATIKPLGSGVGVFRGSSSGPSAVPVWTDESDALSFGLGYATDSGDINGDGYPDLVASAPYATQPALFTYLHGGTVDTDGDGVDNAKDCAPYDPFDAAVAVAWYKDGDADGYGQGTSVVACAAPAGYVALPGDCNDGAKLIHPLATETCDGVDQNCDGTKDEQPSDGSTWHRDADGDNHGTTTSVVACVRPSGYAVPADDCDDLDATRYPGAPEQCDGQDDDCDTAVDESAVDASTWYADADADGFGGQVTVACSAPAGHIGQGGDCDDTHATVAPGQPETCNGRDDDCDNQIDESAVDRTVYYTDADADGHGGTTTVLACTQPVGTALAGDDCSDTDATRHPGGYGGVQRRRRRLRWCRRGRRRKRLSVVRGR